MVHPPHQFARWRGGLARAGLVLAGLLWLARVGVCGTQLGVPTDPRAGVKIGITSWYESAPFRGFAPVEVTIENRSGRTRTWTMITSSPQSYAQKTEVGSVFTFTVEDKDRRSFHVLAPLLSDTVPYYQAVSFSFEGHGVSGTTSTSLSGAGYGSGNYTPFAAISSKLLPSGTQPLIDELKLSSRSFGGSRVEIKDLPEEWRALAGAECLYLLGEELAGLGPAQRVALQDWLAAGGELTIFGANEVPPDLRQSGFGKVFTEAARSIRPAALVEKLKKFESERGSVVNQFGTGGVKHWGAFKTMGEVRPNALLLSLCMLLFAAVIGPVNLFFLAASHRRARLFWTTPALSVGASALLFVVIIFQDGFGGWGVRNAVICLQPERKKAAVLQEQIARTGVLAGSRFQIRESALISPIAPSELGKGQNNHYAVDGNEFTGDWFRSRSLQAQWVQAIVPTRAEITVTSAEGAAPTIISSIDAVLQEFYYHDAQGRFWTASNVATGRRVALHSADKLPEVLGEEASRSLLATFQRVGVPRGSFYATTTDPKLLIPTLTSIRWERRPVAIVGPVTEVTR
jgi:hypothetical protein